MASEADHIAAANLNQKTLAHLCQDVSVHGPWVAVVAFYKALHVVEAVFANDPDIRHCTDHGSRERALKMNRKYAHINKQYAPLSRAATIARYLHHSGTDYHSFFDYLDATNPHPAGKRRVPIHIGTHCSWLAAALAAVVQK